MSSVNDLHTKAVDLAEEAFLLKKAGDAKAIALFLEALEFEEKAAFMLSAEEGSEPSRSIIFRSAASLALNAGNYEKADWLIANGLAGFPPFEISEELKNLYEEVNFQRHLALKGIKLSEKNWLMTLQGNATGYGTASMDLILYRMDKLESLYYRTVERLLQLPYRENGSISKDLKEKFELFISAFAPGSFGVSFHVGKPDNQLELEFPDMDTSDIVNPEDAVDEIMTCFKIFESEKPEELKDRIQNEIYYENFIGLTKQIAPDGDKIKMVGFLTNRNGKDQPIALRKNKQQIKEHFIREHEIENTDMPEIVEELTGLLIHAHSPQNRKYGLVKLVTQEQGSISIHVPIALMKDVVQPYYEENVQIQVIKGKKKLYLKEIQPLNI